MGCLNKVMNKEIRRIIWKYMDLFKFLKIIDKSLNDIYEMMVFICISLTNY